MPAGYVHDDWYFLQKLRMELDDGRPAGSSQVPEELRDRDGVELDQFREMLEMEGYLMRDSERDVTRYSKAREKFVWFREVLEVKGRMEDEEQTLCSR